MYKVHRSQCKGLVPRYLHTKVLKVPLYFYASGAGAGLALVWYSAGGAGCVIGT